MTGFPPLVRAGIKVRALGRCERCRATDPRDIHHRRARGMGGTSEPWVNAAANGVYLCGDCHAWAEANFTAAQESGWRISLHSDLTAAEVPLIDLYGRHFSLGDDLSVSDE